jgi:hypothetical protein
MATNEEVEIHRQLQAVQEKYTYFLLAAVGACIAFALNQTKNESINCQQVFLALAVVMWGLSFFCGCRYLQKKESVIYANVQYLKAENGAHPIAGNNPAYIEAVKLVIQEQVSKSGTIASRYKSCQFYLFIGAVIFYVTWHVLEMFARANA